MGTKKLMPYCSIFLLDSISYDASFDFNFSSYYQNIKVDKEGHIIVDEFQNTSRKGIYAVGDVCGKALLTPGNNVLRTISNTFIWDSKMEQSEMGEEGL